MQKNILHYLANAHTWYLLFVLCCVAKGTYAQEEVRFLYDTVGLELEEPRGSIQIVRIRQGYMLGDGITFRSTQGNLNLNQTLQTIHTVYSNNNDLSKLGTNFAIRRARLNLFGNIFNNKVSLSARLNFATDFQSVTSGYRSFNTVLQEANIEYRLSRTHAFNFGLRADYIDSREVRIEGESLGFVERSAVSEAFDAIFDFGIRYKGLYNLGNNHWIKAYAQFTTGDSRSALQNNFGGFRYGVRIDYLPFGRFARFGEFYMDDLYREDKPKLVIGGVFNHNTAATSAKGTNGGRWIYGDANQNQLFPSATKFGTDYLFKYNGFYSLGSFVKMWAQVPEGIKGEFRLNGSFISYPASQTAEQTENLVRSRINLGSGFNVQAGYVLRSNWAFGARYSSLSGERITTNFADFNRYYSFVTSKYFSGHNLKLQYEIGFNELKKELKVPNSSGQFYSSLLFTIQI